MNSDSVVFYDDKYGKNIINLAQVQMVRYDGVRDITRVYFSGINCEYPSRELYDKIRNFIYD